MSRINAGASKKAVRKARAAATVDLPDCREHNSNIRRAFHVGHVQARPCLGRLGIGPAARFAPAWSAKYAETTVPASNAPATVHNEAGSGWVRRHQRQPRSTRPTRRAWIGSPAGNAAGLPPSPVRRRWVT